jgi:hypothetical protein
LSGAAFNLAALGLPFFISGVVKIAYDGLIYFTFKDVRPPEEQERRNAHADAQPERGTSAYEPAGKNARR